MKKGRKKDHVWQFVRYKFDTAIYARCSCGFRYSCCKDIAEIGLKIVPAPEKLYPYCPICGARKTKYIDDVIKLDMYPWEGEEL